MSRIALALLSFAFCPTVPAGVIRSPTLITQNTLGNLSVDDDDGNLIDQGGLSVGFASGVDDFDTYVLGPSSHSTSTAAGMLWNSPSSKTNGDLDFDLGESVTIFRFALWSGGNGGNSNREINSFSVFTAADSSFTSATNVGMFSNPEHQTGPFFAEVYDLVDTVGRFVRLRINSNHGGPLVKAGELAFDTSSASVPEPTSGAFLSLGIVCYGFRVYRRKKRQAHSP